MCMQIYVQVQDDTLCNYTFQWKGVQLIPAIYNNKPYSGKEGVRLMYSDV